MLGLSQGRDRNDLSGIGQTSQHLAVRRQQGQDSPQGKVTSSTLLDARLTFFASDIGQRLSRSGAMIRVGNAIREAEDEGV